MDILLTLNIIVLALGCLVLIHSFVLNVLFRPIHEGMIEAAHSEASEQ